MDLFKGNALSGLAIGIGAAVLSPVIIPILASVVKPLTKAAIKGGIIAYGRGIELAAEIGEVVEDLVVEAKAELVEAVAESAVVDKVG
ncbi:DUF5132 domain-containing protein [Candidatus Magnetominusculus dajiuhuensis]|uniref:DUF5132 domain-containing protein n=1 Tax=Candidatus Magnetominusculus dajiuhuensis TaxID=3137712 RepID=UPI003B43082C